MRPKRFETVLAGFVPGTDIRLGRMREGERVHRPGWDITFSAPKSVSLEALVMGDRRVIRAHDEAVRATLDWVEADLLQTRGWDPATRRRPRVKAHGMVVAGFRHLTSRDLDPFLHTHCVLANMTHNAAGEWRSVEPTAIRRSEKLIGAYYRNELARRLEALGMAIAPRLVGRIPGFELAGYSRTFVEAFSGRRLEIEAYMERNDLPYTAKNTQTAALHTRKRKRDGILADLVPAWRARARALGLVREKVELSPPRPLDPLTGERSAAPRMPARGLPANELRKLKRAPALPKLPREKAMAGRHAAGPRAPRSPAPAELSREPELGLLEAVARAVAHVEERQVRIPEAEIRAVALGHAPGRYMLAEVDEAIARLVRSGELIETEHEHADRAFVTDRAVKTERRMLASMRAARGQGRAEAEAGAVAARLRESGLTEGQRQAVRTILLSRDRVTGVQGHAGSGKTTMLRMVKELLGERTILGLAPSASAARVLAREADIPSRTLQWFLTRHEDLSDPARLARARSEFTGAVLAVDEASMIDTVRMEALLRIARDLGVARVALVGDTAQLRAVDAGQPFRVLQKAGMATAVMDEVLRQEDPDLLKASGQARAGEPGAAIRQLGRRVHEYPREELGPEAGRHWLALAPEDRADALILAPTHAIRRQVNETVREGLEAEGLLHGRVLVVDRLVNRRLTRARAADIRSYEPGDTVVFHRDVFGCRAGDVCMVTGTDGGHVVMAGPDGSERRFRPSGNAATYFGLYDTERIELRAGERIRWTRNRKAPPARFGHPRQPDLVNGGEAEILEIDRRRVRFCDEQGRTFSFLLSDPQLRHLDHAYCSTVHAAQGRTARGVIAVLDAHGAADQAMFHVEVSRAAEAFLLLTDDREALVEMLEARPGREEGALEALGLDPAEPPVVEPELFEALAADWRALRERGEEEGTTPFFLSGYGEVMARAAALSAIEDLPADMRRFTDAMLAEHEEHLARDREVRDLAERIRAHWRRWPELGWAASARGCAPEGHGGTRNMACGGGRHSWTHAARGSGRTARRIGSKLCRRPGSAMRWRRSNARASWTMPGGSGAAGGRFASGPCATACRRCIWTAMRRWRNGVDGSSLRKGWMAICVTLSRNGRPPTPARRGLLTPSAPFRAAWRHGGNAGRGTCRSTNMGRPTRPIPPAAPGAGKAGRYRKRRTPCCLSEAPLPRISPPCPMPTRKCWTAAIGIHDTLQADRLASFGWLARHMDRQVRETGTGAYFLPRYGELIAHAQRVSQEQILSGDRRDTVHLWLDYRERQEELRARIRDWPERADALLAERPAPDARYGPLMQWRRQAEGLLGETRTMLAEGSSHGPHLAAMPDEGGALREAVGRLDDASVAVEGGGDEPALDHCAVLCQAGRRDRVRRKRLSGADRAGALSGCPARPARRPAREGR